MPDQSVRTLTADELVPATKVVAHGMLGSLDDEISAGWAGWWEPERSHGAFSDDVLVGVATWFPGDLSVPGGSVPAGLVSAVAVLPTHRRQGHLSGIMAAQLHDIAAEGRPVATLVAAEWPIYGRFGYGPAVDACTWVVDATTAALRDGTTGSVELVSPPELRPHLEACHDARAARTPGAVTRLPPAWDRIAGVLPYPGDKSDPGLRRGALWRDSAGEVRGAVAYTVADDWTDNRPRGRADVGLLVGATPEAERELWRHLVDLDWVATVKAGPRAVDDPLPLWLTDGRAAVAKDRFDHIWARILDVPATFGAYRSELPGTAVVEVTDVLGFADGRWRIDLGPDGAEVTSTRDDADVAMPVGTLSAVHLGGRSLARLHQAGWLDEERPGGVARLDALLATPMAPWSPTSY